MGKKLVLLQELIHGDTIYFIRIVWYAGMSILVTTDVSLGMTIPIGGKKIKAGKYGLYSIPGAKEWTIILNNKSNLWGADNYSQSEDAVRLVTPAGKSKSFMEKMTILISDAGKVSLMWGDTMVDFSVQ
jgi:hypothetical protein